MMTNDTRIKICYAKYPSDVERKTNEFLASLGDNMNVYDYRWVEPKIDEGHYALLMVYGPKPKLTPFFDTTNTFIGETRYELSE